MNKHSISNKTKILFFAVRSHHYGYFCKLAEGMPESVVISKKKIWLPLFVKVDTHMLQQAVTCLILEYKSKYANISGVLPLLKGLLGIRARILCACYCRALQQHNAAAVAIWNGQRYRQMIMVAAATSFGVPCLYFENGLLPHHSTIDNKGVNFLNSMPRKASEYLRYTKQNTKHTTPTHTNENYIFVPFQVETDSQMLRFSPWIESMYHLTTILAEASQVLPDMWYFICKLHPAEPKQHTWLPALFEEHPKLRLADKHADTHSLIKQAQGIITINSTVGIEAIVANKKVIVLGKAFYAINGLTLDAGNQQELGSSIKQLAEWEINQALREGFMHKLNAYQVPGNWKNADANHLTSMRERIYELV